MAVVGSTIMIDLHLTEDGDIDTVRGAIRQSDRVDPDLAGRVQQAIERETATALGDAALGEYSRRVNVDLVSGRVPGAPRERLTAALDFEGEESVLAALDDAITAPDRAQIADEVEATAEAYLQDHALDDAVTVTVSITPIQFR
jgi:hypothetical protein